MTLKELRIQAHLSQASLGYRLGVSFQTINNWEKHRSGTSAEMLERIEKELGQAPDDIKESFAGRPKHDEAYYLGGIAGTEGEEHTFRYLRMRLRKTQKEVAELLKVDRMTYNRWETYKQPLISEIYYQQILALFGEIPIGIAFAPYGKYRKKRPHQIIGDNIVRVTKSQKFWDGVPDGVPYIITDEDEPHIYRPGLVQYKYSDDQERLEENRRQWEEDQKYLNDEY